MHTSREEIKQPKKSSKKKEKIGPKQEIKNSNMNDRRQIIVNKGIIMTNIMYITISSKKKQYIKIKNNA